MLEPRDGRDGRAEGAVDDDDLWGTVPDAFAAPGSGNGEGGDRGGAASRAARGDAASRADRTGGYGAASRADRTGGYGAASRADRTGGYGAASRTDDAAWDAAAHGASNDGASRAPGLTRLPDPERLGQALWHALYARMDPGTAPPFGVILVEQGHRGMHLAYYDSPPGSAAAPPAWDMPTVQQYLVMPLMRHAREIMGGGMMPALILLPSGVVYAASNDAAYAALVSGQAPEDPHGITVQVHPAIAEVWSVADAVTRTPHPLVRWTGAVVCLLLWAVAGIGIWVWGTEIVVRLAQAMGDAPITETWSALLRLAVSAAVSALEITGLLLLSSRVARGVGGMVAALDVAFHAWYGWRLVPAADLAAQVVAALIGVGTALVPELVVVALLSGAVRLSPLLVWSLFQLRMIWLRIALLAREESERYRMVRQEEEEARRRRPVTVIDTSTGRTSTYWAYGVVGADEEEDDDAEDDNGPAAPRSRGWPPLRRGRER